MENNIEREQEVKILNVDIDLVESKLVKLGARKIAEEKQTNTLIDSTKNPIKSFLDGYLRIRETKDLIMDRENTVITLKKSISNEQIRDNLEMTVEIDNKDMMIKILNELGFDSIDVGFKLRKSYSFKNTRIDLDTWDDNTYPYPYMEVEFKDINDLYTVLKELDIDKGKVSTKSIKELKDELNK
ncbi:MAG TPA: class IV adenylate cyclase [Tissierellaceae bacterium]